MLALNEELVAILRAAAAPIAPAARSRFYEAVDRALVGLEPGPGNYARICAELQPKLLNAPAVDERPTSPSKQVPRSPFRRRG
jgi:hypothetical protein